MLTHKIKHRVNQVIHESQRVKTNERMIRKHNKEKMNVI